MNPSTAFDKRSGAQDYRDDHSPDIALLLTVARAVQYALAGPRGRDPRTALDYLEAVESALKPFEHHPNPVDQLQDETQADHDAAKEDREWTGA